MGATVMTMGARIRPGDRKFTDTGRDITADPIPDPPAPVDLQCRTAAAAVEPVVPHTDGGAVLTRKSDPA
jgi:hypothetical protein